MMGIEIYDLDGMEDFVKVDSILRTLIGTIEGTIPGSRDFGLSGESSDCLSEDAINTLLMELDEKAAKYLPEISIESAEVESIEDGSMLLRISVGINEEGDADD